jgi:hypothetical protein
MTIPFGVLPVDQGGRYDTRQTSPGAGRWADWCWPDPLFTTLTSSGVLQIRNRMNNQTAICAFGSYGGGSSVANVIANTGQGTIMGGPCVQMVAGASDGQGQILRMSAGPFMLINTKPTATKVLAQYNDFGVWRIYANIAYGVYAGGGAVDSGLQITNTGGLLIAQGVAGFGFNRTAAGVIKFTIIPVALGGATVFTLTSAATFNELLVHSYEVICFAATPSSKAILMVLIDGVVVLQLFWNPGVNMPDFSGTQLGFTTQIVHGQANSSLYVSCIGGIRIIQAPTLAACY